MSMLVKGEKMPRCCNYCAFHKNETIIDSVENGGDYVTYKNIVRCEICGAEDPYVSYRDADTKRRDDCPLVEIPPHGRLIDADYMKRHLTFSQGINDCGALYAPYDEIKKEIDRMPTVIESEKE